MGFKTAGFPSFGFNPIGFRKSGSLLQDLIKNCGLIQYATPVTDKVGKSSRDSVRGKALVGDGSTYATADWTQASALWDVEFEVSEVPVADGYVLDARANGGTGRIVLLSDGSISTLTGTVIVTGLKYLVQGVTLSFSKVVLMANSGFGQKLNANVLSLKLTNKSTGITYTLAIESRQSDGIIPLNGSDGSVILCEQFLSPATPVVNSLQESYFDALGGTFADGSQYLDVGLTVQADVGTPLITNHAFTASGNISPQYNGRVKYDNLVCDVSGTPTGLEFASGRYIRLSQPYDGITENDTNRILTEADGTPKVLAYDTMADNTLNQYFTSADRQKLMFFETPISGECETKALKELGFNESLLALDVDGDYAIDADGDYVYEGS